MIKTSSAMSIKKGDVVIANPEDQPLGRGNKRGRPRGRGRGRGRPPLLENRTRDSLEKQ